MEEAISYRFSHLRIDDQNSIYSEKVNSKNIRSQKGRITAIIKIEITKIFTGSIETTAVDLIVKNDSCVLRESSAKA